MVFTHQIRNVISDYLSQKLDLHGFVQGFAPLSHNIVKNGEPSAVRLANGVEALLAGLRTGCIRESQFQSGIRELAALDVPNVYVGELAFPSSVNLHPKGESAFPWEAVGTSPGTESGLAALHQG